MTDEIGRVRCPFCLELGARCRARQLGATWERCCPLCQCEKHERAAPPPAPAPWVDLGMGGKPIHPQKCSPTLIHPGLDLETGRQCARMGCMHCGAVEYYRTAMRRRLRGVVDTEGEGVYS